MKIKIQKLLSITLSLIICLTTVPTSLLAATEETTDGKYAKVGTYLEGDKEFNYYRGYISQETTSSSTSSAIEYYYSDGYFYSEDNTIKYNNHLATFALELAKFSYDKEVLNKIYNEIGVAEDNIYINEYVFNNYSDSSPTSIGLTIAGKKIDNIDNASDVIIVNLRSSHYQYEWVNNVTIGNENYAQGFYLPAQYVKNEIDNYLNNYYKNSNEKTNPIILITGYSRGAGVANITAKLYKDTGKYNDNVVAYCFATPQTTKVIDENTNSYIFNIINKIDLITYLAPSMLGFSRFGSDTIINNLYDKNYQNRRTAAIKQLEAVNPSLDYQDNISYSYLDIEKILEILMGSNESNLTIDDILPEASTTLLNEPVNAYTYLINFIKVFASESIISVDKYTSNDNAYGISLENAIGSLIRVYYDIDNQNIPKASFTEIIENFKKNIPSKEKTNYGLFLLSLLQSGEDIDTEALIDNLDSLLKDERLGITKIISEENIGIIENNILPVINALGKFLNYDMEKSYIYESNEYPLEEGVSEVPILVFISTAIKSANVYVNAHLDDVYLSWIRTYDSFYMDSTDPTNLIANESSLIHYVMENKSSSGSIFDNKSSWIIVCCAVAIAGVCAMYIYRKKQNAK